MAYDVAIIGGGIVGCATAFRLASHENIRSIAILEKEDELARHQTGRNSGVIHSGIYYAPGSLKAENCRVGRRQLLEFCDREGIAYDICGKVIVATRQEEIPLLHKLLDRGVQNGIVSRPVDTDELHQLEPHVQGLAAIHVPDTGIIDFRSVCLRLGSILKEMGHTVRTSTRVTGMDVRTDCVRLETTSGDIEARVVVNCAGLFSDRVAALTGTDPGVRIVPFRGVYYELTPETRQYCQNLIYPVPDPAYPFLGVHFSRTIDGRIECGPNAVLATGREAYHPGEGSVAELMSFFGYSGFRKMARRHWRTGMGEMIRTASKRSYLRTLRRLIPSLNPEDIVPGRSGIRAQAIDREGKMVDDFLILESDRLVNVCNAPSPAATAGFRIGQVIAQRVQNHL